jgi:hypothetical protein
VSDGPPAKSADSRLGHTAGVVVRDVVGGVHGLRLGDRTLAERARLLLAEVCEQVVEVEAPAGEVEAVLAALEAVEPDHVLVLSADRPLLSPDLVIGLAGLPDADAAIPRADGTAHTTCARYRRAQVEPALRAAVDAGPTTVEAALAGLDVVWLEGGMLAALDPECVGLARVRDAVGLAEIERGHPECAASAWPGHPGLGLARSDPDRAAD